METVNMKQLSDKYIEELSKEIKAVKELILKDDINIQELGVTIRKNNILMIGEKNTQDSLLQAKMVYEAALDLLL